MNIINHLSQLESAGLVSLAQVMPDVEYLFRHTLVQEAAYASLLDDDQKNLHHLVGEAIEQLYPDQLVELAPSLARHFEKAGEDEKAASYYERAGKDALDNFANKEAEENFRNALRLTENKILKAELHAGLGESLAIIGRSEEAIQAWKSGIELYSNLGDSDNTARLYARAGRVAWFSDNPKLGLELCQRGMEEVANAQESPGVALLLHETGRAFFFNNEYDKAQPYCEKALKMSEKLGAVDVQAESLTTLGILPQIKPDMRMQFLEKAVQISESAGLLHVASRAQLNLGTAVITQTSDRQAGREHYLKAADLARRSGAIQSELFYRLGAVNTSVEMGDLEFIEQTLPALDKLVEKLPSQEKLKNEVEIVKLFPIAFRGHWSEVAIIVQELIEHIKQHGTPQEELERNYFLMNALYEQHRLGTPTDLEALYQLTQDCVEAIRTKNLKGSIAHFLHYAAAIKAHMGEFDEAHRLMESARQNISDDHHRRFDFLIDKMSGVEIYVLERQWGKAIEAFTALKPKQNEIDILGWAWMLMRTAEAYMGRGEADDLESAQGLLQEAGAIFTKLKSPIYLEKIEELVKASRQQTYAQAAVQRQVTQELRQAGQLQSSFLPVEPPVIPGWQIAAKLIPARQTTGDYYDFIPLPNGRYGIAIADVADKGIGAALFMASSRTLLRAYAVENAESTEKLLSQVNARITQDTHGGLFTTLFYGILEPSTGSLIYSNAGHNPPYLIQPGGEPLSLSKTGVPLGIFPDATWHSQQVSIEPGSLFVLYTDGVTEANDTHENLYGEPRLLQAVLEAAHGSAQVVQDAVLRSIDNFRAGTNLTDDLTLVVIRRD